MRKERKTTAFYRIDSKRFAIVNEKIETVEGFIVIANGKYEVQDIFNEPFGTFNNLEEVKRWIND